MIVLVSALAVASADAQNRPATIDDLFALPPAAAPVPASGGVNIASPTVQPEGTLTASDRDYDNRVLSAFRNAQDRQGSLDGRWLVRNTGGGLIYALQFSDPGSGPDRVEGAWRDPNATGETATGFIDQITVDGAEVILAFHEGGSSRQVKLRPNGSGAWTGQSTIGNLSTAITMMRDGGLETAAAQAPVVAEPPNLATPKPRAKSRSKSKSRSSSKSKSKAKAKAPTRRK